MLPLRPPKRPRSAQLWQKSGYSSRFPAHSQSERFRGGLVHQVDHQRLQVAAAASQAGSHACSQTGRTTAAHQQGRAQECTVSAQPACTSSRLATPASAADNPPAPAGQVSGQHGQQEHSHSWLDPKQLHPCEVGQARSPVLACLLLPVTASCSQRSEPPASCSDWSNMLRISACCSSCTQHEHAAWSSHLLYRMASAQLAVPALCRCVVHHHVIPDGQVHEVEQLRGVSEVAQHTQHP